jgi:hypothetical protein
MDAVMRESQTARSIKSKQEGRIIDAILFRKLLTSHRRMVRADRRQDLLRGLQDLDTGEVFLTDEQRLLDALRS